MRDLEGTKLHLKGPLSATQESKLSSAQAVLQATQDEGASIRAELQALSSAAATHDEMETAARKELVILITSLVPLRVECDECVARTCQHRATEPIKPTHLRALDERESFQESEPLWEGQC